AVRIVMLPHIFARSSPGPAVRSLRYAKVPVTLETVKFHRTWFAKFGDLGSDASAAELLLDSTNHRWLKPSRDVRFRVTLSPTSTSIGGPGVVKEVFVD